MKRSDLDTATVLRTIAEHRLDAYQVLTERFPPKVVLAAFMREDNAGRIEYGTSIAYPWLTPAGRVRLAEADLAAVRGNPGRASGGIIRGPGAADDDRIPFPTTGCMFADRARVFVLPAGRREGHN